MFSSIYIKGHFFPVNVLDIIMQITHSDACN